MKHVSPTTTVVGMAVGFVVVIGALVGIAVASEHASEQTRTCTVTDKDRTTNTDGASDARIYTEQCGTLKVADLLTRGQFNSADIFASIEPGHTYQVTSVGWRIGILSTFPTVVGKPYEVKP